MDISTGRTYETRAEARAAGVSESDIAQIFSDWNGEPRPVFTKQPQIQFTKGSYKPVRRMVAK